ncbi:phosphatidate phosphatase LPIN1-like isoform X2 [Scleropages formosus]|uniref:phosphatidate phosphatase n=2 Tax=Scleropages formosus TaxID=113540 RepID=A0A8C9UWS6_SCLFO|nr:phosphatidate phosphatase LPIN1 isoform X2 [Scleropages formosus]
MISVDRLEEFRDDRNPIESTWSWTQTMNYVGQLAGQVFVQVKELYRGLNPATLSGCIDVIVVRQPDGTLQCSPFHVRFGKMGVLRSREKLVDIEINGEPVSLHMKLGENGEAFFVKETENDQEVVPSYLATSPIISEGVALMGAQLGKGLTRLSDGGAVGPSIQTMGQLQGAGDNGSMKKRRKRRRKCKVDSVKREDNEDNSEDEDLFPIDMSSDEEKELDGSRTASRDTYREEAGAGSSPAGAFKQSTVYARSDGEWSPVLSKPIEHTSQTCILPIPASGGLSVSCPLQSSFFQPPHSPSGSRPSSPKSDSELVTKPSDKDKQNKPEMLWAWGELPQAAKPSLFPEKTESPVVLIPVSESTHFRVIPRDCTSELQEDHPRLLTMFLPEGGNSEAVPSAGEEPEGVGAPAARLMSEMEEGRQSPGSRTLSKTDSPSKKKDKRSRHLGADGVYLDDITEMEPEVAALYFPKSDGASAPKGTSENVVRSTSMSPQSIGSSGVDSGVDSFSDQLGDLPSIAISLCGGLTDNKEITKEQFQERAITYQQFAENPSIIDDPNLVVKIGSKYYNWSTAAPLMLAMQAFQKPLPKATVENIMKEKMPKKGGRWWFSWRGRNSSIKSESAAEQGVGSGDQDGTMCSANRRKDESSSSDEENQSTKQTSGSSPSDPFVTPAGGISYKKTLRLTSEQLMSLQLKEGPNDVVFSVTTQYQGTCRCEGTIYLWSWDDKIVISDIDGTITRSDTLGHILPTLGKDWTHQGIARLYHKVSQNGYKFLYCSARAIGMADMTRGYLHWVNERGTMLPLGPVLLSPSSLFSALHREVIEKKPEKFKIECLTDIKNLFHPNTEPFYAAFGNRPTDVYSYKEVGVPLNRIFTVNPKGELVQEHAKTNISSYVRLSEVVDHVFPLLRRGDSSDFPCSDTFSQFTYWREQLPEVENQDENLELS